MLRPPVQINGDKHLYRDEGVLYLSHSLMQDFITYQLSTTESIVSFYLAHSGKLESIEEIAATVEKSPRAVKKAVARLKNTGILNKLLDQGVLEEGMVSGEEPGEPVATDE